jgi:hypothetical protein
MEASVLGRDVSKGGLRREGMGGRTHYLRPYGTWRYSHLIPNPMARSELGEREGEEGRRGGGSKVSLVGTTRATSDKARR